MILDKNINITINSSNFKRFKLLGYDFVKCGQSVLIDVADLSLGSHVKVTAKCVNCHEEKKVEYCNYKNQTKKSEYYCSDCKLVKSYKTCKDKYGVDNPSQSESIKEKKKSTHFKNYGVEHTFQSKINIEKRKKTLLKKYNVTHNSQIDFVKESKKQFTDKQLNEWKLYKRKVRRLTNKTKQILFENWNGYDYYDNEYIKEYHNLDSNDRNYPTIDHKISVFNGFKDNISVEFISSLENLCVTKRFINSTKNINNEFNKNKIK